MSAVKRGAAAASLLVLTLAAACSALPAGSGWQPSPPATTPSATATPAATPVPTATQIPTPTATASMSAQVTPTPSEWAQPMAQLSSDATNAVAGFLGSWCHLGTCADTVPPSRKMLPLLSLASSGAGLTFSMPATDPFVHWSASYSTESDAAATLLDQGGHEYDVDAPPTTPYPELHESTFAAPPHGDWVLAVSLGFDGGYGGDASYYWRVVVP